MWGSFSPVELKDFSLLSQTFSRCTRSRLCDYTVGGVLMWRRFFQTEVCADDCGGLIFRTHSEDETAYALAVELRHLPRALEFLEKQGPLQLCAVSEDLLPALQQRYADSLSFTSDPAQSDYLYLAEDLRALEGKKYHAQRNHMADFSKKHPHWEYLSLGEDTLCMAMDILTAFEQDFQINSVMAHEELLRAFEALKYGFTSPLFGGLLAENGRVLALSIGEVQGDTLFVHVEKALRQERGAYQTMAHELLLHCPSRVTYVNREEDDGVEGLRRAKEAYHPCTLLKKYRVSVNSQILG